ncbi:MAG: hypothetical protein J4432_02105 [DPANN group archaeon]|nr:hypothetical protein [DPANN group archaeon]
MWEVKSGTIEWDMDKRDGVVTSGDTDSIIQEMDALGNAHPLEFFVIDERIEVGIYPGDQVSPTARDKATRALFFSYDEILDDCGGDVKGRGHYKKWDGQDLRDGVAEVRRFLDESGEDASQIIAELDSTFPDLA